MRYQKDTDFTPIVSGHIHEYDVFIHKDMVIVLGEEGFSVKRNIKGMGNFITKAKDVRLGWAIFPDFEVVYIYDKADHNFGYGLNLQDEMCSEWGSAPF